MPELRLTVPVHERILFSSLRVSLFDAIINFHNLGDLHKRSSVITVVYTNNELKLSEGVGLVDRRELGSFDRALNERERRSTQKI